MQSLHTQKPTIEKYRQVLIIEDNVTTALHLENLLKRLGFVNIKHSDSGHKGLKEFQKLIKSGNSPIVFLDYALKDINGLSILSQLLQIDIDGTVIIQSAFEKDHPVIQKLIEEGAYEYIQKPIHYPSLKKIIDVVEAEGPTSDFYEIDYEQINRLLETSSKISLTWLAEYSATDPDTLVNYLKELEAAGKIKSVGPVKDILCNNCNSVKTGHIFSCPSCHNFNFKHGLLIEHYDCAYSWVVEDNNKEICPQCNKKLKATGVDHRISKNCYSCIDCGEKFSELECKYVCLRCNNKFELEEAKWKTSAGYSQISKLD